MPVQKLLQQFKKGRASEWPFNELIAAIRADAAFAERFATAALASKAPEGTYFDLTLGHVPEPGFAPLVSSALAQLEAGESTGLAESVITYAGLQSPQSLHPHLERVFRLHVNGGAYYSNYSWRESWPHSRAHLLGVLDSKALPVERRKAWECLLECRTPESMQQAVQRAPSMALQQTLESCLHEVGFSLQLAPLYSATVSHVVFDSNYFRDDRPPWIDRNLHPTWRLQADDAQLRFGGAAESECGLCHGNLHHLLTLPQQDVSLATCISCMGWEKEVLFYQHGVDGRAASLDHGDVTPQFPATALVETTVRLAPTPPRWRWQEWSLANSRENLFRVGGYPCWIQSSSFPSCPGCTKNMPLLMQLDSDLPSENDEQILWGSGGICYVFWCAGCRISAVSEQHT